MADDTSVGSKRRITEIEFEDEPLRHQQRQDLSSSGLFGGSPQGDSKESSTTEGDQETNNEDNPSPSSVKKVKCSFTESETSFEEKQEVGVEENESKFNSLIEKKVALCELVSGSFGSGEFDDKIESSGVKALETDDSIVHFACGHAKEVKVIENEEIQGSIDNVKEVRVKERDFVGSESLEAVMGFGTVNNKEFTMVKEIEGENLLEAKQKQLLEEVEVGSIFKNRTCVDNNVVGFGADVGISRSLKGFDESVRRSLKIEVVDDTVLIEPVLVTKAGKGGVNVAERNGMKHGKQENDEKKAKRHRRRGKVARKGLEASEGQKKVTQAGEARQRTFHVAEILNGIEKDEDRMKRKYSRDEMEALRFANIVEQRKMWREIYTGLGDDVVEGYKDLANSQHQKNMCLNFNPRECSGRKKHGIIGEESSGKGDSELEILEGDEVPNVDISDPACWSSIEGEGANTVLEGESGEENDSDDDYASIQRPAFLVEGEPDFDSGPPEDGLEYLRRVRWEAARVPKVKAAKLDRSKVKNEQTVYMPQIPDIAKCPEHLLPSKQWEDAFLADFCELRLFLSQSEASSTQISHKTEPVAIVDKISSSQLTDGIIVDKFSNLRTDEVQSYRPPNTSGSSIVNTVDQLSVVNVEDGGKSASSQNTTPGASVSDASCNYPLLSVILAMDSVARVSMLRWRIKLAEMMDTLTKNDCLWLFALCVAVDAPLDADVCAALRSLLRKCANLRASKSELDDEVIMLNILATISGRYFGQSES